MELLSGTPAPSKGKLLIIAVVYEERDYWPTMHAINATTYPVYYVHRRPAGIGSLAEACNRGFREGCGELFENVWFVTNVTFPRETPDLLLDALDQGYAAVHPSFDSDHEHLRNVPATEAVWAPFIEFTAPMINSGVFGHLQLDENMPDWGHDLDFSYRLAQLGMEMAVDHRVKLGHTYIRHKKPKEGVTLMRQLRRKETDNGTRLALRNKYSAVFAKNNRMPITELYKIMAEKMNKKNRT
jgi:hypothetical protein